MFRSVNWGVLVSQSKTRAELLSQTCKGRSSLGNNMQMPCWGQQCAQSPRGSKGRENVYVWKIDLQLHYRWNSCFARVKITQLNVSFHFPSRFPSILELLNSCPLYQWCHPTICQLLVLLPSIFPSIRFFPMSWLFASGGQGTRA